MKTKIAVGLLVTVLCGSLAGPAGAQSKPAQAKTTPEVQAEPEKEALYKLEPRPPFYDPAGRRDPFKDLLGGSQTKERTGAEGAGMSLDELRLVGIAKFRGKMYALVTGPQSFPYRIKEGDKFSDGFVLKITADNVTFRKTAEKGVRLPNPKDIIKDLVPEER